MSAAFLVSAASGTSLLDDATRWKAVRAAISTTQAPVIQRGRYASAMNVNARINQKSAVVTRFLVTVQP